VKSSPLANASTWTVAQWHDLGGTNQPPLAVRITSTGWELTQRYGVTGAEQEYSTFKALGPVTFDEWTDFVVSVRWDYRTGGNGRVRCWMNEDADGSPRIDVSRPIAYDNPLDRKMPYFKTGDYSAAWRSTAPESPDGTIHESYSDAVRIMTTGGTRALVKPKGSRLSAI